MKKTFMTAVIYLVLTGLMFTNMSCNSPSNDESEPESGNSASDIKGEIIALPEPETDGEMSLESAIYSRISRRDFIDKPMDEKEISQLLWASQGIGVDGITGASRTAPSAGATHPFDVYLVAGNIDNIIAGIYQYNYETHELTLIRENDCREELAAAALSQGFIASAPASIILVADYSRTTGRYGERGEIYVHMEAGNISQNIHLQAEALNLGTVVIGAFNNAELKRIMQTEDTPLIIMPVGHLEL